MITANMLLLTATNLRMIVTALIMELVAKQHHPERHPGPGICSSTQLARYLGDYLKKVVATGTLALARDDTYKQFAGCINAHLRVVVEDEILSELQWELGDDEPDIPDDYLAAASPMRACL